MKPSKWKSVVIKYSVQGVLQLTAFIARRERLAFLNNAFLRSLAKQRAKQNSLLNENALNSLEGLGYTWQKAFPSVKQVPITDITDDTVYAEIRTPCPLRGSGDLNACYRMMEYDRSYLKEFGGEFVVLESQAEPSVECCRVAMQHIDRNPKSTLIAVHQKGATKYV